jgi:glycine cleavage system H lipoate-binding protein
MIKLNLQGGIFLEMDDILCEIVCSDNTHYFIRSCIKGFLLEINELLIQSPQLIQQKASTNGYIAIINPKWKIFQPKDYYLTLEQYENLRKNK